MLGRLLRPIDIAPLVFFRTVVCGMITIELLGELLLPSYRAFYTQGEMHFSYVLLPWLEPWPPAGVWAHMLLNIALGVMVTAGFHYRLTAALAGFSTLLLLLMEKAAYINHSYLYSLLFLLGSLIPAHGALSLDVRRGAKQQQLTAPAWTLYVLRFQLAVVYIFAGLAKLNGDWLRGVPMTQWQRELPIYSILGRLVGDETLGIASSWGGAAFDLLVVPCMLWRRSRSIAFGCAACFHISNALTFGIGTFPWVSLAMTALFFPPGSFRRLPILRSLPKPALETALPFRFRTPLLPAALALHGLTQLILPLRPYLLTTPGWTEFGQRFSWRMMLRAKEGALSYRIVHPGSNRHDRVDPCESLPPRTCFDMESKPDMIVEFAHFLSRRHQKQFGGARPEVYADAYATFNDRPSQRLIDPTVDLATQERTFEPYPFIVPLGEETLERHEVATRRSFTPRQAPPSKGLSP